MSSYPIKVMLVDDQSIVATAIEQILKSDSSILFHYCKNPLNAIDEALEFKPTVILQDLVMPEIDGLTLVNYFKRHEFTKHIPLVVLSSKEEPDMKAACFSYGASDYLVKLPDKVELLARIKYHSHNYIRLLERNDAFTQLKESQTTLQKELDEASLYVKSLLPDPITSDKLSANWIYIPSTALGGDVFNYEWLDPDHFAIYLLDVCGHGVGAALLSVSILNTLKGKTLPKVDYKQPHTVLKALNAYFPMEKHQDMFFTFFYAVMDLKKGRLLYSSGGHPPQLLIDTNSKHRELIQTDGIALGVDPNATYETKESRLPSQSRLVLFSDGTFEIRNSPMLPFTHYVDLFAKTPLDLVIPLIGKPPFDDDFSFLEIKTNSC